MPQIVVSRMVQFFLLFLLIGGLLAFLLVTAYPEILKLGGAIDLTGSNIIARIRG